MKAKRRIQIFISVAATLIGLLHLLMPNLKIDAILITLIIIAIIPWLEPLLKSVELPGGLKVEFQDLKKIEEEAKIAGLIKEETKTEKLADVHSETYSFIEIAEKNQELALVGLRIEIEKRLRGLAEKYSIKSNRYSIGSLIDKLSSDEILSSPETLSLKDMINTLNHAAHGMEYDYRNAVWVIENGPKILSSLDDKLEFRGGRFSLGSTDDREHWIDKSYKNCEWATTYEWGECISQHTILWEKELEKIYISLTKKLKPLQKDKLIKSHENWKTQIELEKDFLYSFEDLRLKVGSGGMMVSATNFMNKVRERTLELEEVLNLLAE